MSRDISLHGNETSCRLEHPRPVTCFSLLPTPVRVTFGAALGAQRQSLRVDLARARGRRTQWPVQAPVRPSIRSSTSPVTPCSSISMPIGVPGPGDRSRAGGARARVRRATHHRKGEGQRTAAPGSALQGAFDSDVAALRKGHGRRPRRRGGCATPAPGRGRVGERQHRAGNGRVERSIVRITLARLSGGDRGRPDVFTQCLFISPVGRPS